MQAIKRARRRPGEIPAGRAALDCSVRKACPNCGCEDLRRSHRRGWFEVFLSVAGVFPWRCQNCGTRIRRIVLWEPSKLPKDERRLDRPWIVRLRLSAPLQFAGYLAGIALTVAFVVWLVTLGGGGGAP